MQRGRILIMGQTKESTYEIRNLLDNKKYELEIALSKDVGKTILAQRHMNLLILHTEVLNEESKEFFDFLTAEGIELPVFILGEDATRLGEAVEAATSNVSCFDKPYPVNEMLESIGDL